jgi:hypothetical protein
MMKVNMSKPEFKELFEEYISKLEKDYDFDIKGNRNQPIFSLIQNTYQKLKDKYYRNINTKPGGEPGFV